MLNAKEGLWNRGLRHYANNNTIHEYVNNDSREMMENEDEVNSSL